MTAVTVMLPDSLRVRLQDLADVHTGGDVSSMILRLLLREIMPMDYELLVSRLSEALREAV